ncbi:hypothetical protein [Nocardia jinanensis]|uniref:Uncharacterized protein n=1 Tax=Nocardia jinanensis TaxID=382504 RepID=A0A917RV81_9NOCA|nr:hypothetical protein [Nocardia jinanensis]GGL38734.1 hypothetical protein GCM10011588_61680 [Nocardia jinanensis]
MRLTFLGKGGSESQGCPALYATDENSYLVQGWETDLLGTVEIPHLLTGFAEPDTYLGANMTDTGRGTFRLSGQPVTDPAVVGQLDLAGDETAILVAKRERTFFGNAASRG